MKKIINTKAKWHLRSVLQIVVAVLVFNSLLLEFVQMYDSTSNPVLLELLEDFETEKESEQEIETEESLKELDEFLTSHVSGLSVVSGLVFQSLYCCTFPSCPFLEIKLPPPEQL